MAIKIQDVLDYLERHPICDKCGDVKTLLGMVREIYIFYSNAETEPTCALCREREQVAFEQGVNWVQ